MKYVLITYTILFLLTSFAVVGCNKNPIEKGLQTRVEGKKS